MSLRPFFSYYGSKWRAAGSSDQRKAEEQGGMIREK